MKPLHALLLAAVAVQFMVDGLGEALQLELETVALGRLLRMGLPYLTAEALQLLFQRSEQQIEAVLPDEPALDEAWAEPEAFGGCSTAGQSRPGQPQPIQIVRAAARQASTQPGASA